MVIVGAVTLACRTKALGQKHEDKSAKRHLRARQVFSLNCSDIFILLMYYNELIVNYKGFESI